MKPLAVLAVSACCLAFPTDSRFAHADLETPRVVVGPWAGQLRVGPGMDARGANLRGCEFVGQDLSRAVFDGCDLGGVRIVDCTLASASFRGARLTGATIGDCIIDDAVFDNAVINSIKPPPGRNPNLWLSDRQLMSTKSYLEKNLHDCWISGGDNGKALKPRYDFRNADLRGATIRDGDLSECDFTGAKIRGITMRGCTLPFAKLVSTDDFGNRRCVHDAILAVQFTGRVDFSCVNLSGCELLFSHKSSPSDFTDATITACTLGPYFTKENLYSTRSYRDGNLLHVNFSRMNLHGWDFSSANLTHADFATSVVGNAVFRNAVITGVRFPRPDDTGLTVEQIKSTWNYQHGRMKGIILPDELAQAIQEEKKE